MRCQGQTRNEKGDPEGLWNASIKPGVILSSGGVLYDMIIGSLMNAMQTIMCIKGFPVLSADGMKPKSVSIFTRGR